jgi:hypothetical protein
MIVLALATGRPRIHEHGRLIGPLLQLHICHTCTKRPDAVSGMAG